MQETARGLEIIDKELRRDLVYGREIPEERRIKEERESLEMASNGEREPYQRLDTVV